MLVASLFLSAHEIILEVVISRIKAFLCFEAEIKDGKLHFKHSEEYVSSILKRELPAHVKGPKKYKIWYASILWLLENDVIDEDELIELERIRLQRNNIAHDLMSILIDDSVGINTKLLVEAKRLIHKIELWWLLNVEIPSNPDYDNREINVNDVESGNMILINYLVEIVTG